MRQVPGSNTFAAPPPRNPHAATDSATDGNGKARPLRVVAFGTYQADLHPRVRVLIEGLRAHGHEVVEINEPLGLSTADRVSMLRAPWRVPLLMLRLARRWISLAKRGRQLRRQREASGEALDAVLVGYLGHFDVHLAKRVFPSTLLILDHMIFAAGTAQDRGQKSRPVVAALDVLDRKALSSADVIVLDTVEHQSRVPASLTDRTVVCPVGADYSWFAAALSERSRPRAALLDDQHRVRAVFFGVYTPLHGTETIGAALRLLGDAPVHVTMIGTGQFLSAAKAAAGPDAPVDWIDWIDPTELPKVVARHQIALGIFGTTEKAANVIPNKVYQSAAAGCAVITSDTKPQRRVLNGNVELVPAGSPEAIAETLRRLADNPELLAERREQAAELAERAFTPDAVVAPLLDTVLAALIDRGQWPHHEGVAASVSRAITPSAVPTAVPKSRG